jgi:hypothetical protein
MAAQLEVSQATPGLIQLRNIFAMLIQKQKFLGSLIPASLSIIPQTELGSLISQVK